MKPTKLGKKVYKHIKICEISYMNRTVNLDLLDLWLGKNGGVKALAKKSHVSPYTIMMMKNRKNPTAPRKRITQLLLADALGVELDELFPTVAKREGKAS